MRRRLRLRAATESRFAFDTRRITVLVSVCLAAVAVVAAAAARPSEPEPEPDPTPTTSPPHEASGTAPTTPAEESLVPALEVPATMRTVTVVVRDPLGLDAGDTVDVVATLDQAMAAGAATSSRVVRRAVVRSVAPSETGPGEVTVSLLVTPEDVGRVEFAARHGTVALSLAPTEDDGVAPSEPLPGDVSAGGGPHPADDEDHDE